MKKPNNESEASTVIELEISIYAPVGVVWNAITDSDELENWWGDKVELEPRVGGKFSEPWEDDNRNMKLAYGKVLSVKRGKEIVFTWKEDSWEKGSKTQCTIRIEDKGKSCVVKISHSGWETLPADQQKQTIKDFKVGWNYHLKELQAYLEQ